MFIFFIGTAFRIALHIAVDQASVYSYVKNTAKYKDLPLGGSQQLSKLALETHQVRDSSHSPQNMKSHAPLNSPIVICR